MAINKMTFVGVGGIDLTGDTAVESDVAEGKIFHKADGTQATGIASGGDTLADLYINRTLTRYENNSLVVPQGMFAYSHIIEVSFPQCQSIYSNAFIGCISLTTLNFPLCIAIENYAFKGCTGLLAISFPEVKKVNEYGLSDLWYVQNVSMPKLDTIYNYGLSKLNNNGATIKELSFPELKDVKINGFEYINVKKINMPKLEKYASYAFAYSKLEEITLPSTVVNCGFRGIFNIPSLKKVIVEMDIDSIPNGFIGLCNSLQEISFLNCSQVPSLPATSYLDIPSTCTIKVPAVLEEEWKQATNWSSKATQIVGV